MFICDNLNGVLGLLLNRFNVNQSFILIKVEQPKRTMANWMNWLPDNVKGFAFSKQGYNQYGLYHDDLYIEDEEDVQEALRQLPPQHLDERAFRAQRTLHYAMLRTVLPKEGLGLLRGRQEERILFEALL